VHPLGAGRVRVRALLGPEARGELALLAPHAPCHIVGLDGVGELPTHATAEVRLVRRQVELLPRARIGLAPVSDASRVHRSIHCPKRAGIRELQGSVCGLAPRAFHEQEGHTGATQI
jgi:hypothetical protein